MVPCPFSGQARQNHLSLSLSPFARGFFLEQFFQPNFFVRWMQPRPVVATIAGQQPIAGRPVVATIAGQQQPRPVVATIVGQPPVQPPVATMAEGPPLSDRYEWFRFWDTDQSRTVPKSSVHVATYFEFLTLRVGVRS